MAIEELTADWNGAGIEQGDTVLVHSSLKDTIRRYLRKKVRLDAETLLKSFLNAVGSEGTLLLPLFNFDFTKESPFDIRSTPSQMGALTEAARLDPRSVRTGHPIYSFAVIGKNARKFDGVDNKSGYGPDSPFGILRQLNGKIAVLSLPDQNSMTFYHHVEEMHSVSYRYLKHFTGQYTDNRGTTQQKTYSLFVRDVERGVLTHVDPTGELMWEAGLYSGHRPNRGCGLRVVSAVSMYEFVSDIITSGRAEGLLYRVESC